MHDLPPIPRSEAPTSSAGGQRPGQGHVAPGVAPASRRPGTPSPLASPPAPEASEPPSVRGEPARGAATAVERLRTTLATASQHIAAFERAVGTRLDLIRAYAAATQEQALGLEAALAKKEGELASLAARVEAAEEQAERLLSLYVATHQLHSTLDPAAVEQALADIVEGLLGAERFALLLRRDGTACEVALAKGLLSTDPLASLSYRGGDAAIDGALADGVLRTGASAGPRAVAVVPLRVQEDIVGVLVIGKLFGHKLGLTAGDCEMLELLASHAASALFLSRLHATADRKRRTLEGLVALARRS